MPNSGATSLARARRMMGAAVRAGSMMLIAQAAPATADSVLAGRWRFDEPSGQVAADDGPFAIHGVLGAGAQPGARLLLYTDGLIEAGPVPIDDGLDALLLDVESHRDVPIGSMLDDLVHDGSSADVCLLCLEYTPLS